MRIKVAVVGLVIAGIGSGAWWMFAPLPVQATTGTPLATERTGEILEHSFPPGMNLDHYLEHQLRAWFEERASRKVFAPESPALGLYQLLAEAPRLRMEKNLKLPAEGPEEEFFLQVSPFRGATIDIGRRAIELTANPLYGQATELEGIEKYLIGAALLFEAGEGIHLIPPGLKTKIYLLQINQTNLRAYTVTEDYFDKTYREFSNAVYGQLTPEVAKTLICTIIEGFPAGTHGTVSPELQILICDTVGIYLAESFRFGSGPDNQTDQRMVSAILLALYLLSGGKDDPSLDIQESVEQLFVTRITDYREKMRSLDQSISGYFTERHPLIVRQLNWYLPRSDEGLLERLEEYAQHPVNYNQHMRLLVKKFVDGIAKEAKEIPAPRYLSAEQ